ncbi:ankyrin repeat domain-containing protein [Peribacillus sp. FSL H8-0477]|uniref:ankyrin repeat domain-containing protein n=1 Tax=Peribacillus sp. FSL H8-0477 TaxID=2921388 RepID=UPI0030F98536
MKRLFVAIKHGDLHQMKAILKKNPALINCTAKHPPKKDDGQSPLQVAIKTGNFKIADYLIDAGADVNFIESESCNEWKMPVIQDAIRATIMSSRFLTFMYKNGEKVWEPYNTKEQFNAAFTLLKKIIEAGADIHSYDSYGNSCLGRAVLDAKQVIPAGVQDPKDKRPLNNELKEDLTVVFRLLFKSGANINEVHTDKEKSKMILHSFYKIEELILNNAEDQAGHI